MSIIEGTELIGIPGGINVGLHSFNIADFLFNGVNLMINVPQTKRFASNNIIFSTRNKVRKGVHRKRRALKITAINNTGMTTIIIKPVIIKMKNFV